MARKFVIPSESQEQRALVKWLNLHPILKHYFYKNHNEGKRTALQTHDLKLLGLRPGVSDLFIPYPSKSRKHAGLWLEVKRNMHYPPSARKTETWINQEIWLERMKNIGFDGHFCYGCHDGIRIIECYLSL